MEDSLALRVESGEVSMEAVTLAARLGLPAARSLVKVKKQPQKAWEEALDSLPKKAATRFACDLAHAVMLYFGVPRDDPYCLFIAEFWRLSSKGKSLARLRRRARGATLETLVQEPAMDAIRILSPEAAKRAKFRLGLLSDPTGSSKARRVELQRQWEALARLITGSDPAEVFMALPDPGAFEAEWTALEEVLGPPVTTAPDSRTAVKKKVFKRLAKKKKAPKKKKATKKKKTKKATKKR